MSHSDQSHDSVARSEQQQDLGLRVELPPKPIDPVFRPFVRFLHIEAAGGIALFFSSVVALILANSALAEDYSRLWESNFRIGLGSFELSYPLWYWINDALMAIFFFVVGLEIKREMVLGEFRDLRKVALPVAAALGGAIAPALIYLAIQPGDSTSGWGVPMATDIAFVVGTMALLGNRVPQGLKLFVLTLAIVDDIIAVTVIAIFFTAKLNGLWLAAAAGGLLLTWSLSRLGVRTVGVYVCIGAGMWLATLKGGVHPTVTGALLGLLTPASAWLGDKSLLEVFEDVGRVLTERVYTAGAVHSRTLISQVTTITRESFSPLERLEVALHPWVAFVIMPVFALANAAVPISLAGLAQPVAMAVAIALVIGKPLGIVAASVVVVRLGWANLPQGVSWLMLAGAGSLAGIGFTMSLFVAGLALAGEQLVAAKSGVLLGSLISGVLGVLLMSLATRRCYTPA
jgi:NhaA family Na+:H+ antiporter